MVTEIKLLPCPFCGSEAETFEASEDSFSILCTGCGVETPYLPYLTEAIAAWNRRAEDERYKNALKEIINLACESVEREKTLAKLEAEVMALEPKCGEWVKKTYTHEYANEETEERQYVVCSICGKQPPSGFGTVYYCPNCGAKMEDKL
jgi:Lar family restriction alleviation protein